MKNNCPVVEACFLTKDKNLFFCLRIILKYILYLKVTWSFTEERLVVGC